MRNSFYKVARDIYGLREFLIGETTGLNEDKSSGSIQIYPDTGLGGFRIVSHIAAHPLNIEIYAIDDKRYNNIIGLICLSDSICLLAKMECISFELNRMIHRIRLRFLKIKFE